MPISNLRNALSDYRALLPYAILGVVAGACSAGIILLFDLSITLIGGLWLGDATPEGFEQLPAWARFALPLSGALVLGLVFNALRHEDRETGIVHVVSRMHSHYGELPIRNAVLQFLGGALALGTGASGGREGPGVHLGAAINSNLARYLQLPNNSQRILIACGTAGGIAVAFNTPLAGVIFAMEVIVLEYTVVGFTPVILAAVTATAIGHASGTTGAILVAPQMQMASLLELPFIALLGMIAGCTVSLFIYLLKQMMRFGQSPVLIRFAIAGLVTGSLAIVMPQIMGMGYDTLNDILSNQLAPGLLLALVACKLLATAFGVGLGMPIGLIGPNLLIGACVGGLMSSLGAQFFPELASEPALYVLIGMGAAMAAVLNAPLAALLCVLELSGNIGVVFPSMLAIVAATLTTTIVFKQRSAHQTALVHLQRNIPEDALSHLLHQTNVLSVMDRQVKVIAHELGADQFPAVLENRSHWFLLQRDAQPLYLVQGAALAEHIETLPTQGAGAEVDAEDPTDPRIDLTELDLRRWTVSFLSQRATAQQAADTLRNQVAEAIIISHLGRNDGASVSGVITRDIIEQYYLRRL
jgi:H+/Cl- antiporter ClcA